MTFPDESDSSSRADPAETILVVDDEEFVLNLVSIILTDAGYNILRASGGHAAIALCQNHHGPIHLALLDVSMPKMNGPELYRRLSELVPRLPILYMSGYSYEDVFRHEKHSGTIDYLGKPFTPKALLHRVRRALLQTQ